MSADTERHSAWRRVVRRYISAGDRGEEPHFVGRQEFFDRIHLMLEGAVAGQRDRRTIVVAGAPGAGKSAFVREAAKRLQATGHAVVELRPGDMTPFRLFEEVARAFGEPLREEGQRGSVRTGEFGTSPAKGRFSRSETEAHAGDPARIARSAGMPWTLLKERFGDRLGPEKPLVLFCDEAQNLEPSPATGAFLDSLHHGDPDDAAPIPLVPVYAGLPDTVDALDRCGVTRPTGGNEMPIGQLSPAESMEYALKTLTHLGAEGSQAELAHWASWFVANCDNWPQHLRGQMTAVAEEMLQADTPKLKDPNTTGVAHRASNSRNEYYGRRLRATEHLLHRELFAALAQAAAPPDGVDPGTLAHTVDAYVERIGRPLDVEETVRSAIHAGILQAVSPSQPDRLVCPIPSLQRWLEGREHIVPPP